jgi:hypothetical protein
VGTISLTQTAGGEKGRIDTQIQYERPAKLYLKQQMLTASGSIWLVTSDGKYFSYNKPRDTNTISINAGNRLIESIINKEGKLDLGGIYAASAKSLGDRSTPLDIAIARKEDLSFLRQQWATIKLAGSVNIDGVTCWKIVGDWREYGEAMVSGVYTIVISESGDLKMFCINESLAINGQAVPLESRWDVNLTVGATPNQDLFKVVL